MVKPTDVWVNPQRSAAQQEVELAADVGAPTHPEVHGPGIVRDFPRSHRGVAQQNWAIFGILMGYCYIWLMGYMNDMVNGNVYPGWWLTKPL